MFFFNSNLTKFSQNFLVRKAIREPAWGLQKKDKHNPHKQCPASVSTKEKKLNSFIFQFDLRIISLTNRYNCKVKKKLKGGGEEIVTKI